MVSVIGDVTVDSKARGDFTNFKMCRLSFSEVLIEVEFRYYVYVVVLCNFQKKLTAIYIPHKHTNNNSDSYSSNLEPQYRLKTFNLVFSLSLF